MNPLRRIFGHLRTPELYQGQDGNWYVDLDGRPHNLGNNEQEATTKYHKLLRPETGRTVKVGPNETRPRRKTLQAVHDDALRELESAEWLGVLERSVPMDVAHRLLPDSGIVNERAGNEIEDKLRERLEEIKADIKQAERRGDRAHQQELTREFTQAEQAQHAYVAFWGRLKSESRAAFRHAVASRLDQTITLSKRARKGEATLTELEDAALALERDADHFAKRGRTIPGTEDAIRGLRERARQLRTEKTSLRKRLEFQRKEAERQRSDIERERKATEKDVGLRAESLPDLEDRVAWAKAHPNDPRAAQILRNAPATAANLRKTRLAQSDVDRLGHRIEQLRKAKRGALHPEERAHLDTRIRELQAQQQDLEERLAKARRENDFSILSPGDRDLGNSSDGVFGRAFRRSKRLISRRVGSTKGFVREQRVRAEDAGEAVNDRLRRLGNNDFVRHVGQELGDSARVSGFSLLWRMQANRYARQEEAALEAQRKASSRLWRWWYSFSRPVRTTFAIAMFFGPVMVPVGLLQFAGWMFFALFTFVANAVYRAFVEVINLGFFAWLSIINVSGQVLQQGIDFMARRILSYFPGQCIDAATCVYQSLAFNWGVRTFEAAPLIDPRRLAPTIFNNNSMLSALFDLMGGLPTMAILGVGLSAAFVVALVFMARARPVLRVAVATAILAVTIPAFFVHDWASGTLSQNFTCSNDEPCNFYHFAADMFRTGIGNRITDPAHAFAEATRAGLQGDEPP